MGLRQKVAYVENPRFTKLLQVTTGTKVTKWLNDQQGVAKVAKF